jgi:hypothetical protein
MLWTILVILLIMWLLGFSLHIGGSLIHGAAGFGVGGTGH